MSQLKTSPIHSLGNNAGFTLLEIIAVMVIMSILAVVAVPRYFGMQDQARERAMHTAMAEAKGRINSYFAQQLLNDVLPDNIDYSTLNVGGSDELTCTIGDPIDAAIGLYAATVTGDTGAVANMGDFHMEVTDGTDDPLEITVYGFAPAVAELALRTTMKKPGV